MNHSILPKINYPADLRQLSDQDLKQLAIELRNETIKSVSETGGHLGSSLGVVELTVAIHSIFNTPHDKLIWDVGHQCYPHKIITGRKEKMKTLRQEGGLSGFTKRSESNYDPFGAAHSSENFANSLPGPLKEGARRAKGLITGLAGGTGNTFFEDLGFSYVGPIDGHDLDQLLPVLRTVKTRSEGPVVIHCVTKKGAGYAPAETASDKYHGVSKFDVVSGKQHKL